MLFKPQYHLDMIDTSSKMSLKMSCLKAADNNVERARELYDFLLADITDIPDFEAVKPSGFEAVKQSATEVIGWLSSHRDDIAQGVSFIQSLRKPIASAATNVPPIPKI